MTLEHVPEDEALAQQAAQGDRQALEALLERHATVAVQSACGVLRNYEDALDAAQSALIYIAQAITRNWSGGSFRAWVALCAQRAAVDQLRQHRNRRRLERPLNAQVADEEAYMPKLDLEDDFNALHEELASLQEASGSRARRVAPAVGKARSDGG